MSQKEQKILIVEDQSDIAHIYLGILEQAGFQAELLLFEQDQEIEPESVLDLDWDLFELVLLDRHLPFDFRMVTVRAEAAGVPVILISGDLDPPEDVSGIALVLNKLEVVGRLPEVIDEFVNARN